MKCSLGIASFLEEISSLPILLFPSISVHLRRASYRSFLFSVTLHSVGYIFPFLLGFSLLSFPQLFVKPPQTTTLPSCTPLCLGWFWSSPTVAVQWLSHVRLFATPWTVAYQAPLSMGFPRQEYWSALSFPSPGDLPNQGVKLMSPALQVDSLPLSHQGSHLANA